MTPALAGRMLVRLSLDGDNKDLVFQTGVVYEKQSSVEAYEGLFAHYAGWDWPTVSEHALRYVAPVEAVWPQYLEEIRGIDPVAETILVELAGELDSAGLDLREALTKLRTRESHHEESQG